MAKKTRLTEMTEAQVSHVSLVKRAANRIPFRVVKSDKENGMIDLGRMGRALKNEVSAPIVAALVVMMESDSQLAEVEKIFKANGFSTDKVIKNDDGSVVYPQTDDDLEKDSHIVRVSDDLVLIMKGFSAYSEELYRNGDFSEQVAAKGFHQSMSVASDAFRDLAIQALSQASSPADAAAEIKKTGEKFIGYIATLADSLPTKAFKMSNEMLSNQVIKAEKDKGKGKSNDNAPETGTQPQTDDSGKVNKPDPALTPETGKQPAPAKEQGPGAGVPASPDRADLDEATRVLGDPNVQLPVDDPTKDMENVPSNPSKGPDDLKPMPVTEVPGKEGQSTTGTPAKPGDPNVQLPVYDPTKEMPNVPSNPSKGPDDLKPMPVTEQEVDKEVKKADLSKAPKGVDQGKWDTLSEKQRSAWMRAHVTAKLEAAHKAEFVARQQRPLFDVKAMTEAIAASVTATMKSEIEAQFAPIREQIKQVAHKSDSASEEVTKLSQVFKGTVLAAPLSGDRPAGAPSSKKSDSTGLGDGFFDSATMPRNALAA